MYSLGAFLVSSDDDMRPSALIEHSPESLAPDEICRGKLMKAKAGGFEQRSFDLFTAFNDVLGKTVRDLPGNYEKGDIVTDTSIVSGNLFFEKRKRPCREPASGTSRETTANRDNQNVFCFARDAWCNWNRLQPKLRITA